MKTIGLLGGMSWESTASYYKAINEGVRNRLGGFHSAPIVLNSVDFHEVEQLQQADRWDDAGALLAQAAKQVESGGADFLLLCTNTMHKVADAIEEAIDIPLLHIADATGEALQRDQIHRVGLLGTRFTMEQDFYKQRLIERFGIQVTVPSSASQRIVHDVIYNELIQGDINDTSKTHYLRIIQELHQNGAQAVILGCTEIALLVSQADTDVPLYDTTAIHAQIAVDRALI